jgi:hypothetical protein
MKEIKEKKDLKKQSKREDAEEGKKIDPLEEET